MRARAWFGRIPGSARASRRASAALAVILLALALAATASSWYQSRMINLSTASMATGDAYREARYLATAQKTELLYAYVSGRSQEERDRHAEIGRQLVVALQDLREMPGNEEIAVTQETTGKPAMQGDMPGMPGMGEEMPAMPGMQASDEPAMTAPSPGVPVTDRAVAAGLLGQQQRYLGLSDEFFDLLDSHDTPAVASLLQREINPLIEQIDHELHQVSAQHYEMNMTQAREMTKASTMLQVGTPLVFGVGLVLFALLTMITRSHRRNIQTQARQDALTGLPNRISFHESGQQALRDAAKTGVQPTMLVLDLDGFKDVNDSLGHYYGDQLLIEVGKRLRTVVRAQDVTARLGGDEFAVLLVAQGAEEGTQIARRITTALHAPFLIEDVTLDIEASIGIATAERDQNVVALIRHADTAMYLAKEHKLGYTHYDGDHDKNTASRLGLLGALRRALDAEEIVLHYQPKIALDTGEMSGVEALARWQHPTRGLLSPAEFIPVLESTTLGHRFTAHVLAQALAQTRRWLDEGIRLPVAVNVSTRCLLDERFPDTVARLLAGSNVPGELLCVEITENTVMADPTMTISILRRLRELGAKIAIDDFGTGYSSMTYLKMLPVDELKIDRSFVGDMTADASNVVLVQSAVDLGHNLGLAVVAEGVEDIPTLEMLRGLGCDIAQGYYFARPLPADQVTALMKHPRTKGSLKLRT